MAGHDHWHTPPGLYRLLDEEFNFGLDASCSTENCLAPSGITEAFPRWSSCFAGALDRCRRFLG